jgi:hypothetical protein
MNQFSGILSDIADIVGSDAAYKVASSVGGTRVSIPPRAIEGHWLTDLLGFEQADAICRGLATLDPDGKLRGVRDEIIPKGPAAIMRAARRRAKEALESGSSARDAARISGLHERTIWRMKAKEDDGQGELF